MEGGVKARGEAGVHHQLGGGIAALQGHGVADHADVADQAADLDPLRLPGELREDRRVPGVQAEGQLLDAHGPHFPQGLGGLAVVLPAGGAPEAVGHGQVPALPGLEIVLKMGVLGVPDPAGAVGPDPRRDGGVQRLRPGEAQGPVHEVVLIVDDKEAVHSVPPFPPGPGPGASTRYYNDTMLSSAARMSPAGMASVTRRVFPS